MIGPLSQLSGENLDTAIKALNNRFHVRGFMPVRYSYSELKEIATFLNFNSDEWSFRYNDAILSQYNYAEVTFIKRLSKAIDNPEELKRIQYDVKIANNSTRRIVYGVLEQNKKNKSMKDKLKGMFQNA
ncbi:MAG: hypothetical protein ABW116_01590 [Candidatus Sedimenticola sp. 20ELBAFRAG]